ncbi:Bifunctional enzyme CysN/CysC [Pseudidiomarina piscicola]|uniref:Multifunctional fusion protein n=1 Tax=Pseudidiomarina piscicola TaxID=2614830 RepID=A0A6S6WKE3_9GAMM|nr:sulfate adenylyltransferase subunit CysN [Pseudidiomarina piscicola]CAB0151231.1 Bifunctional enzyme CysN/CysC [Pseudidiomarina piscicola]VZT40737.1 Bifunctional enzyme CysN/CysC [Pseudomonas aeruginosa]
MSHKSSLIETDILKYLAQHENKELLRFITCGSVDDGKSTLIGRLLHDSQLIYDDQLDAITANDTVDLAQLVDGLQSEREQGITIDVAYRYFSTDKRKFIIADTPGHEQYTRNMATGASTSDLAVILIDAEQGVQTQTKRHSFIVSLLGIKHVIVAVNKMDRVNYQQSTYKAIQDDYLKLAGLLDIPDIHFVPISALNGDNVVHRSTNTPWFRGRTLMQYLETLKIQRPKDQHFRFPVQLVQRPQQQPSEQQRKRGYAGSIASGTLRVGDTIRVLPSGKVSTVTEINTFDGALEQAQAPQAVTLSLNDELDISRGDMIVEKDALPYTSSRLRAKVVWLHEQALEPQRDYLLKMGTQSATAHCEQVRYGIDINTLQEVDADHLGLNEIGLLDIRAQRPLVFDGYKHNRATGSFILIDKLSNATVAAGMIEKPLAEHAPNTQAKRGPVTWQSHKVSQQQRAALKDQKPVILWFTGLSGAGKSAIANAVEERLHTLQKHTYLLDGDNIRHGLNQGLGFNDADRIENIRRIGEVAKLFVDAGLIVLSAFISPLRSNREQVRQMVNADQFIEVFVDTPLEVCEQRDPKGLYAKARQGEIAHFTGISSPYEAPVKPELRLNTQQLSVDEAAEVVVGYLRERGCL